MLNKLLTLLLPIITVTLSNTTNANELVWQHSQLPIHSELRGSAASTNILWVVGNKNTVFLSHDQGKSWQNVSPKNEKQIDYNFRDIEVLTESTAIIMSVGSGEESTLQITHDQI